MAKLTFTSHCIFNHIYIFQSLRNGDLRCGETLYYDYLKPLSTQLNFDLDFFPVRSKKDFLEKLDLIKIEIELNHRPLIHIDMHGDEKKGIEINPTGEFVSWGEFSTKCRAINISCKNNLAIILASCFGFNAIREVSIRQPTPFYLLVGSEDIVSAGYINEKYPLFYKTIFESNFIDTALQIISSKYKIYLCDKLFLISFTRYLLEGCIGKNRKERIDRLLTEHMNTPKSALPDISVSRKLLKKNTKPDESAFIHYRDIFLMANCIENISRFQLSFDYLIQFIREEIKNPKYNLI